MVQAKADFVVILTGCIDPGATTLVDRRDPRSRIKDYKAALRQWHADPAVQKIVFCENSGYDLTELQALNAERGANALIELLSFRGNTRPDLGKGFGEMGILEYVLDHSNLIEPGARILKVTGRLYVRNIGTILSRAAAIQDCEIFCDLRENLTWADSRVFLASVGFIRSYLLPLKEEINDALGVTFEHVLARATHRFLGEGRKWAMIPRAPDIVGVSGTTNARYPDSFLSLVRREIFRRLKAAVIAR